MASLFCCGRKKRDADCNEPHRKTLKDFGYKFTDKGELRSIRSNAAFEFEVKKGDGLYNQNHYEALGEV